MKTRGNIILEMKHLILPKTLLFVDSKNYPTSESIPITGVPGGTAVGRFLCFVCVFVCFCCFSNIWWGWVWETVTSDGFVAAAFNPVTKGVMKMNKVGAIFCFHYHPRGWDRKGFILCHCHFSLLSLSWEWIITALQCQLWLCSHYRLSFLGRRW